MKVIKFNNIYFWTPIFLLKIWKKKIIKLGTIKFMLIYLFKKKIGESFGELSVFVRGNNNFIVKSESLSSIA